MPVLGDDFQEGGDGPFDVLPMIGTVIALLASGAMMTLTYGGNGNTGSTIDGGGDRGDASGENPALSDDVVEETQDELVSAEEGRLESTPPEQRPKRPRAPRQIHSVAHEDLIGKKIVFLHIDLEHTGPKGAICQLSVVYMDANLKVIGESDWYIKPPDDAEWDEHACAPHGLKPTSPVIMEAKSIEDVWPEFKQEVEAKLEGGKVGMFLAWNGKGSDLTKLFEVTEVLYRGQLYMPEGVKYFADPMNAIKGYKKNAFNEKNRTRNQPDGYGLGVVYELMFQKRLKNAHNSIVDARAQAEIFKHPEVQKTFDLTQNVILMDEVWKGKKVKRVEQAAELTRSVPMGWSTDLEPFEIPPSRRYTGASGGGQLGPTSQVKTACADRNLAALFRLFFTNSLLDLIARETNRYGNEDWVRPVSEEDYRRHYERRNDSTADKPSEDERVEKRPRRDATTKFMAKADDFDDYDGYASDDDEDYSPEDRHFKPDLAFDNLSVDELSVSDSADSDDDSDYVPYEDEEDLIGYFEDEADDESIDATDQEVDGLSDADYSDDELGAFDYCAEPKTKDRLIDCPRNHPSARHRYKKKGKPWVEVTRGYLLCYFGIIILIAAYGLRFYEVAWMEDDGVAFAFIQNAMTKARFEQVKRFLHFVNNRTLLPKGHPRWNPLQKIKPVIDGMLERFRFCYTIGQYMSVDESMIKYKGKQIRFIQYMPAKPIKHGIKVFVLACAETAYCYGFWVYCGKENDDCSPVEIVARLFDQDSDFLGSSAGRVIYMDNYYTSLSMIEYMYDTYKAFVVGTVSLSKKKSRTSDDFPFHKLSGPAQNMMDKGWIRAAQKKIFDTAKNLKFIIQGTIWKDKKLVGVLHNHKVGDSDGERTLRYNSKTHRREAVNTHPILPDYIRYMRGVDRFDQSMNDYNISLRGCRWYLRLFYYVVNAALANMRAITRIIVERDAESSDIEEGSQPAGKKDPWEKYLGKMGWFKWMVDLGHALIKEAITMEWTDLTDNATRPKWMRQQALLPCRCKNKCVFCQLGLTGKDGPPKKRRSQSALRTPASRSSTTSSTASSARSSASSARSSSARSTGSARSRGVSFGSVSSMSSCLVAPGAAHSKPGDTATKLFDNTRDCGVCLGMGRKRKPRGVERTSENTHKYTNSSMVGCPHLACNSQPVCREHWQLYNSKDHSDWRN